MPPAGVGAGVFAASAGTGVAPLGAGLVIEMRSLLAKAERNGAAETAAQNPKLCHSAQPVKRVAIGGKYMIFQASCKAVRAIHHVYFGVIAQPAIASS